MNDAFGKAAFISLFPMIILMPLWIAFGRGFFGAGGWGVFLTFPIGVLIVFPYHILIAVLASLGRKAKQSLHMSVLLLVYYISAIIAELSLVDSGDTQESVGSALTFAGMPEGVNLALFAVSLLCGLVAMISIAVLLINDVIERRRSATRRH